MKTPDEIKRGLKACYSSVECTDCPYIGEDPAGVDCFDLVKVHAKALIQQLEQDNAQKDERIRKLEREREAMLRQLSMHCEACKYWEAPMSCKECSTCTNPWKVNPKENWEWRGVEEES